MQMELHDTVLSYRVRQLLDKGHDPNTVDADGRTLLASLMMDVNVVPLLLDRGALVDHIDRWGDTPLITACIRGHVGIARLLLEAGANPNHTGRYRCTPLIHSVVYDGVELTRLLLDYRADIDYEDGEGWTALTHAAAVGGRIDIIRLLLDRGANPDVVDDSGITVSGHSRTPKIRDFINLYSRSIYTNKDRSRSYASVLYSDITFLFQP